MPFLDLFLRGSVCDRDTPNNSDAANGPAHELYKHNMPGYEAKVREIASQFPAP